LKTKDGQYAQQPISICALIILLIAANIVVLFVLLPVPWMQKFFLIASPFCPQRPAHSVFIGGQQMPIEARMFGMFGGALLALFYFATRRQLGAAAMPRGWRLGLCVALFGVMAFDGTQALLYDVGLLRLYTPNLYLRLGTGLASGVGIAMLLVPLTNQALWKRPRADQPLFAGWKDVVGLAMAQAALFALTLAGWRLMLLPLSLFNTIAILTLMTALMALILVLITRRAGRFVTWREAVGHFSAGFLLAVLFIAILAVVRMALS
jgi:uncharacterized membrane protein